MDKFPRARLTRRESLKWLGAIAAGVSVPLIHGCDKKPIGRS
jgi:hypothetical protein